MSFRIHKVVTICSATILIATGANANPVAGPTASPDGAVVAAWTQVVTNPVGTGLTQPSLDLRFVIENKGLSDETNLCAGFVVRGNIANDPVVTPTPRTNPQTKHVPVNGSSDVSNFPIQCAARNCHQVGWMQF